MKSLKDEMLTDAIEAAFEYSKKTIIYKRVIIAQCVIIACLIVGYFIR